MLDKSSFTRKIKKSITFKYNKVNINSDKCHYTFSENKDHYKL